MDTPKTELMFVDGMSFFKPRENAPQTIKGNLVIDMAKLVSWVADKNLTGQVRIDLRKSEAKGTYYFTLNTWKPTKIEPEKSTTPIVDPKDGRNLTPDDTNPF